MKFPERVIHEVEKKVDLPDDLKEYLFLLLVREEKDGFRSVSSYHHEEETYSDIYAYVLIKYLEDVPFDCCEYDLKTPLSVIAPFIHSDNLGFDFRYSDILLDLGKFKVPFRLSQGFRRRHTYILGNTGSGKTQLIQQMILSDLKTNASIVVIDSQKDLIRKLKRSKSIDPERLVIVDPWDSVNYPLALNIFDIGEESADPRVFEQHINTAVNLLNFVISGVLDFKLTPTQRIPFNHCIRLMLIAPNTTLQTFFNLLEDGLTDEQWKYVQQLPPISQQFFKNSFDTRKSKKTRSEVSARLDLILSTPALGRMFSSPQN